jgi:MYXO-CTERM domain-containing protein
MAYVRYTPVMRFAWVGASILVGTTACASAPDESFGQSQSAINGGTRTGASHPYAVGLLAGGQGSCSGALIAPNLVLTARHCVSQLNTGQALTPTSVFNANYAANDVVVTTRDTIDGNPSGATNYIGREVKYPASNMAFGNDIALLILNRNVPASEAKPITPAVEHALYNTKRYSTGMTAIGFGITDVGLNDSGTRRIRTGLNILCMNGSRAPCQGQDEQGTLVNFPNEFFSSGGVCSGDSGSSAFEANSMAAGAPISMGVLSRGPGTSCDTGVYTRTDVHKTLIIQAALRAATLGGYAAPAWTQPATPDPEDAPYTPPVKGALGSTCTSNSGCNSKICAAGPDGKKVCTVACTLEPDSCAEGFACTDDYCYVGEKAVPPPEEPPPEAPPVEATTTTTTTTGCSTSGSGNAGAFALMTLCFALLRRRR